MTVLDKLVMIKNTDLFSQMEDEVFESMQLIHHFKETPKNGYIYFEAHLHNALYFLKEGYVKIGYIDRDGNEVIKEIIGKGDVFGQITLLPNNLEGEFAQAYKTDVSLCMFRVQEFHQLLEEHPQIALRFTKQLGKKMIRVENRMVNLLQKTVAERLAQFFINLTKQFPEYLHENNFEMPNIFTHEDIARLIGSSRQSITTTVNQFERAGLLDFSNGTIKIMDVKELQKISGVG
jgi:CRP/FNR family transcriptional regulator, cyclic AMP receptor protein